MTRPPSLSQRDYTVGWVCALPTEMAAAVGMLDELHGPLLDDPDDQNNYTFGRIGVHNVVLACLPAGVTGTISAALVATRMLSSFKLRFGLMVGIGGGVPSEENDIRLGDVVVSKPTGMFGGVIQYDFGKTVQEGRFQRTGALNKSPDVLLSALTTLQAKHMMKRHELLNHLSEMMWKYPETGNQFAHPGTQHDLLYEAEYDHIRGWATCSQCDAGRLVYRKPRLSEDPVIHYGLIASGNQVMRHGATRDRLRKELDVLCFEMEAAGLMDNFPCLIIRGICDYSDSHKNSHWQAFAAAIAAAYTKELLYIIPGKPTALVREVENPDNKRPRPYDLPTRYSPQMLCYAVQHDDIATVKSLMKCNNIHSMIVQQVLCLTGVGHLRTWLDEWGAEGIQPHMTALHYAIENNGPSSSAILSLILQKLGSSMLEYVGSAHTVTTLNASRRAVARGYRISTLDSLDPNGPLTYTPLVWAAILDNDTGVKMLIDAGANVNSRASGGDHTALSAQSVLTPRQGIQLKSLSLILKGGALQDISSQGSTQGLRALGHALSFSNWSLAKILMEAGVPVNVACVNGMTPLECCSKRVHDPGAMAIKSMLLARSFSYLY